VLPLNPVDAAGGYSPYHSSSSFALSPLLISPDSLAAQGFISRSLAGSAPSFSDSNVDFAAVAAWKGMLLGSAWEIFCHRDEWAAFEEYCSAQAWWLEDYALFEALKANYGGVPWHQWPQGLRDRNPDALAALFPELEGAVRKAKFCQFIAENQWQSLRKYCSGRGVRIIGDLPIYVTHDSSDVWAHRDLFDLGQDLQPRSVAGVPPDYFSATGQLWGNPLYDWEAMERSRFSWWTARMRRCLDLYDIVRIDHFRGLVAYWAVPGGQKTAAGGRWMKGKATQLFFTLKQAFSHLPLIAEDLGIITPDVREVMEQFGLQGMKVLQFAFGNDFPDSPYLPHRYTPDCVVYTGTHDNNTTSGWFRDDATEQERQHVRQYLGRNVAPGDIAGEFIRLAMSSVAAVSLVPMQDLLSLGTGARMNRPGTASGNWSWRMLPGSDSPALAARLKELVVTYGRGQGTQFGNAD
jgi:4-alpha-glucanotransferase